MSNRPDIDSLDEWLAYVEIHEPAPRWRLRLVVTLGVLLAVAMAVLAVATVVGR